jgi:translation initiation factor IF-3
MLFFKSKTKESISFTEDNIRKEIMDRASYNTEQRKKALDLAKKPVNAQKIASSKLVNSQDMLKTLDNVLDAVHKYDNVKISTLCELYNAIESGDTKNLIEFLKKKDKIKLPKKKKTYEL